MTSDATVSALQQTGFLASVYSIGPYFYCAIPKRFILESVQNELEMGKGYLIRGKVVGGSSFQARHFEGTTSAKKRQVVLYLGKQIGAGLVPHHRYPVVVDSILEGPTDIGILEFLPDFSLTDLKNLGASVVLTSPPRDADDSYQFRVSQILQMRLTRGLWRLEEKVGKLACREHRGRICEVISQYMLASIGGWEKVAEHPFDPTPVADFPRKKGPDLLCRARVTNELFYFESKWGVKHAASFSMASKQIRTYLSKYPDYHGEKVVGGYAAMLDWDTRSRDLFLLVKKANLEGGGTVPIPFEANLFVRNRR